MARTIPTTRMDWLMTPWRNIEAQLHPTWGLPQWERWSYSYPHVDVIDHEKDVLVRAAIPGVNKEDLDLSVQEDHLLLKGHTHYPEEKEGRYYYREISGGAFERSITLPCPVDPDKAQARFHDGLLEVTLPKAQQVMGRKLEIR